MKLRTLFAVAAVTLLTACETPYRATDTGTVVVSSSISTAFNDQYPNATNVVWTNYDPTTEPMIDWDLAGWTTIDAGDYLVRFDQDGQNYYAWYDSDGNWVGTAYVVSDYATLPSAVNTTLTTQFPSYTITRAHREFQKDNKICYEIVLTRTSDDTKVKLLVDGDGTILKQKTKLR